MNKNVKNPVHKKQPGLLNDKVIAVVMTSRILLMEVGSFQVSKVKMFYFVESKLQLAGKYTIFGPQVMLKKSRDQLKNKAFHMN